MIQLKRVFLVFFLFFTVVFPAASQDVRAEEEIPIKVTFENSSRFQVLVHILSYGAIASSYPLEPHQNMEIDVEYGNAVLLEYPTPPHRTELSPMGSLNELYRRVYLRNDGDNLFIEEKFSGQRVKGKGPNRTPKATISDPNMQHFRPRTEDPLQPENKKKQKNIDLFQQQKMNDKKDKKTRKEDPTQPENKTKKKNPSARGPSMLRKPFV
ncbi:MAG: hypothetical protein PVH61_19055 [Candidatus Aminicenantes bacterium]|jgi:hypothetical protein